MCFAPANFKIWLRAWMHGSSESH